MVEEVYLFNPLVICLFISILVLLLLYYQEKKSYLRIWSFAFMSILAGCFVSFFKYKLFDANTALIGNNLFLFLAALFLMYGVCLFTDMPFNPMWIVLFFFVVSISFFISMLIPAAITASIADNLLLGFIQIDIGIRLHKYWEKKYLKRNVFVYTFVLWGTFTVIYPLLYLKLPYDSIFIIIDTTLCFTAVLGLLILHFYKEYDAIAVSSNSSEFQEIKEELAPSNDTDNVEDELKNAKIALKQNEEKIKILTDNARDLIYRFRLKPFEGFEYISPSVYKITGYTQEEHYNDPMIVFNKIHPDDFHIIYDKTTNAIDYSKPLIQRWFRKDGGLIWLEEYCSPIFNSDGILVAIDGVCRDITERILKEEEMKKSNSYDGLTGIRNRICFQQIIKEKSKNQFKVGIIVVCINGLRNLNYKYGYEKCDALIITTAKIIKSQCRDCDEVFRISGSEFSVLLPEGDNDIVQSVSRSILQSVIEYNSQDPELILTLSLGYSCSTKELSSPWDIFRDADINMNKSRMVKYS